MMKMSEREDIENRISEYESIISELYEEIRFYEEYIKESKEELNNLENG